MTFLVRRPAVVFHLFLAGFALWLGREWLAQGPSGGELLLTLAKAADFEQGCRSVHGIAWWTPSYLQGHTLASTWSTLFSAGLLELGRWAIPGIAGYKVVGLLALVAAGAMMYRFAADLTGSAATAAWAGALYVLGPEPSVRLAGAEHLGTALCLPFAPLLCHRLWRLASRNAPHDVPALALAAAAMMLTNSKMALLFLPAAAAFALWLAYGGAAPAGRPFLLRAAGAALLAAGLALPAVLPLWREHRWMTLFAHDPMAVWQQGFTVPSALAWWDRGGALLALAGPQFATARTFYLGLVGGAALVAALAGLGPLRGWRETGPGRLCLLFAGAALFFEWVSHGSVPVWGGLRETLQASAPLPGWSVALIWLAFAGQAALAFLLTGLATRRLWLRLAGMAAYLFLPLFLLFERIPFYAELRAPASVWNVGGAFCVAVAAALALQAALERLPFLRTEGLRLLAGWVAMAAALLDFAPYHAAFRHDALPAGTYADFLQAADFLRRDPAPGSVMAASGRYFYLELPTRAGRALWTEAATSYLQPRWTRELAEAGRQSPDAMAQTMATGGVGFVLLDKRDPDDDPDFDAYLRSRYPAAFENQSFAVLRCPALDAPALAAGAVAAPKGDAALADLVAAAAAGQWTAEPGLPPRAVPLPPARPGEAPSAAPLALRQPRLADYHTIAAGATPAGRPWVIVPESYHPDWHAEADGKEIPVYRALGGFLAARAPRDGAEVTFRFRPPWWYPASLVAAGLGWLAALGAAAFLRARAGA